MALRPSVLWKQMSPAARLAAAEAFWRDEDSPEIEAQHVEALLALAGRLKFRPKSLQQMPADRLAKHLAGVSDVSDGISTRALISYHFAAQRPLMGAFLDALGISHENGLINQEDTAPPSAEALATAVASVRAAFPTEDVDLYLRTLVALDGGTWEKLDGLVSTTA
jgi:hypothetical protein